MYTQLFFFFNNAKTLENRVEPPYIYGSKDCTLLDTFPSYYREQKYGYA